jgi:hypothetical protein
MPSRVFVAAKPLARCDIAAIKAGAPDPETN